MHDARDDARGPERILAGQGDTFSLILAEMIEREVMARLIERLKKIADEGDFVELPP